MDCSVLVLILASCFHNGFAARILGVFAHPARSNSQFAHAVMSTLASAGHDVTVYSPFKPGPQHTFHHVHVYSEFHKNISGKFVYEEFIKLFSNNAFGCKLMRVAAHAKSESFLKHPLTQQLLHSNKSFDIVFTGAFFGEESLLVFGHKFKAPVITLLPINTWSCVDYISGSALNLAYAPENYVHPFTDKMSFIERIQNALSGIVCLINNWLDLSEHDAILQRQAISPPPPPVHQMARDVALTFVNAHPSLGHLKPLTPNIVFVGGIHIESNSPPLPQELQEMMDSAQEGVVLCSLGSIIPVESMPLHLIQAYINSFKKLRQKVIWKISAENLPKLPNNVIAYTWIPQQRILEHPNLKLFFTHGGLGSELEALRAGVPMVGLPFFADQPYNVRFLEDHGVGVGLSLDSLSEESISSALQTVLNDPSYADNARRVSRIFNDQPMKPADLVVYWTDYILRHGAKQLRPQTALMPWYQRALLDVAATFLVGVSIIPIVVIKVVKIISKRMM